MVNKHQTTSTSSNINEISSNSIQASNTTILGAKSHVKDQLCTSHPTSKQERQLFNNTPTTMPNIQCLDQDETIIVIYQNNVILFEYGNGSEP